MSFYQATPERRTALIQGLRECADFLEAHPEVPVPSGSVPLQVSTYGTDEDRRTDIDALAEWLGTKPYWFGDGCTHYQAGVEFGPVEFFGCAVMTEYMQEQHEIERLGREALAASKAAAARVEQGDDEPFVRATPAEVAEAYESSARYVAEHPSDVAA